MTLDGRHFVALARAWADERRDHAGILVAWSYRGNAFGEIVEAVHAALEAHPGHAEWLNLVLAA